MANWIKCTRKADKTPIYVNIDTAMSMRWNENEHATVIAHAGGDIDAVKVAERPEEILIRRQDRGAAE